MSKQENASVAALPCISLLAYEFGTFEMFIEQCELLAKDIAEENPFGALADGKRMMLLVAIAREWHQANNKTTVET
jgi:hypothetical protein